MNIASIQSAGLALATAVFGAALPTTAGAQEPYPSQTIRIVIPGAAGGINDIVARLIAPGLSQRLGKPVVVENKPGAGTTLGGDIVAKSKPDGHTLLMAVSTLATNPSTYLKMPYDAVRDFAPITHAVSAPLLFTVHPSLNVKTIPEFVALARSKPDEITYGSAGHGTNPHLAMELLATTARIKLRHVPFNGGAPSVTAVLGGHVQAVSTVISSLIQQVRGGKLVALGVTSGARLAAIPNIPTVSEAGIPGYEAVQWSGLLAPANTPQEIIARLNLEVVAILKSPEVTNALANDGVQVIAGTPGDFSNYIKSETVKWTAVAKAAGIQPE